MFKKRLALTLLTLGIGLNAGLANSALIDNGSYTTDTATGWDWLDLSYTLSYSYNELIAATSAGGAFEDYTLATHAQVNTLFSAVGLPPAGNDTSDFAAVNSLIALVGSTRSQNGYEEILGITATPNGGGYKLAGLDFYYNNSVPTYQLIDTSTYGPTFGPDTAAGWLVKTYAVPVPGAAWLFGSALLVLFGKNRRR